MAWFGAEDPQAGFATAAAAAVSLALALGAAALMAAAAAELRSSRADLERERAEYSLDGAQQLAAAQLLQTERSERLRWAIEDGDGRQVTVLGEAEGAKASFEVAAAAPLQLLRRLGSIDAVALQQRLKALAAEPSRITAVADLDVSPLWKACAPSAISPTW